MSEKIKITIVMSDEKQNMETEGVLGNSVTMTHDSSMTLMSTLLQNGMLEGSFCGGRGDCGRCMVQFLQGAPLPTPLERSRLEAQELRQGFRLACLTKPKNDCVIKIMVPKENKISIVTEMMGLSDNSDPVSQCKKISVKRKVDVMESDDFVGAEEQYAHNNTDVTNTDVMEMPTDAYGSASRDSYMIAVDLGTTTIAMQLRDMDTGETVDIYCGMNPQRIYGADVLSRIQASCEGHREALRQCVWEMLEQGTRQFVKVVKLADIKCICVAGNTTMEHLLMGYDVSSLGRSPFTPVAIGLQMVEGPLGIPLYITPGISTFVGGDITAGMYALGMLPEMEKIQCSEEGYVEECVTEECMTGHRKDIRLLIDLGTNGEMVITGGTDMLVTATAAGPAFEGGTEKAVVGTDMIAVTDSLKKRGILDEEGLLKEPYFTEGIMVHTQKGEFRLTNRDIRALQMAKAAVRSGVEILWEQMGRPKIGQVYLAGGFGYYLDVEAAFSIGLLPGDMRGHVRAVGNTSLEGAFRIGRDLCRGVIDKRRLEAAFSSAKSINLAQQKAFEKLYLGYMNLVES